MMIANWVLVVLNLVYVFFTFLILRSNNAMVRATRKQVDELQRQFQEQNRPYICVRFESVRGGLMCLSVENAGNSPARDVHVSLNEAFVANISTIDRQEHLRRFIQSAIYLSPKQKFYCCLGGLASFDQLKKVPLLVDVTYNGGTGIYKEHIEIDVDAYGWALRYDSPLGDISSYTKEIAEGLAEIGNKLR